MQPLKNFPEWDEIYKMMLVEEMPWFCRELDHDLLTELKRRNITGGTFLDVGTGSGTQAIELAKRGFTVTASDISKIAVRLAQSQAPHITFMQDDIVHSLISESFNYIFDRGCFHALSSTDRSSYVRNMRAILATNGLLFLKTLSFRKTNNVDGPHRFTPCELRSFFEEHFEIESIVKTEFRGTHTPSPKALFMTMKVK